MGLFSRTLSRLDELKRALTRDPASRQFLALADEYRRQGQAREAIETLEKGLAQNPNAVAGHVALGRLLQQAGRLDESLAAYQAALKLDPQNLVAIRQLADVHMSRGDKVEAIKKLKLFRGLNPGDKEVNELIRQIGEELAAASSAKPPALEWPAAPPPAPDLRTAPAPVLSRAPAPEAVRAPVPAPPAPPAAEPLPAPAAVEEPAVAEGRLEAVERAEAVAEAAPFDVTYPPAQERVLAGAPAAEEEPFPESIPEAPAEPAPAFDAVPEVSFASILSPETPAAAAAPLAETAPPPFAVEGARSGAAAPGGTLVTETLAELLRSQGHLGEAQDAYAELARTEPDEGRAARLLAIAREIQAARAGTVRGRLEAWREPFARSRGARNSDLVGAVEEVVARLGRSAVVLTDFEGVPVVTAGARSEAESMENLAAELTAFWKNVRRSRAEIGEGALDSLLLLGDGGTAAVKVITPAYALLLKVGPDVPAGRVRFEATRAAEQLRPALV